MKMRMSELGKIIFICLLLEHVAALVQSPPRIIKQPPTDELLFQVKTRADESDKPFIIECEADGEPAPTYSWKKDGRPFDWTVYNDRITQQAGRGTLVIKSPRDEDVGGDYYDYRQMEGQYQCAASNQYGTALTNSVFVRKSELNNFKDEPPKTLTVQEGDPFGIACAAPDGWPKPNVYWMLQGQNWLKTINSSRLSVDPTGKLWFSNVTYTDMSDDFLYACSAASYFRNEYKLGNRVHLHVLPQEIKFPNKHEPVMQYVTSAREVAYRGKELRLWCIFGGTPLPNITWRRKDKSLPQDRILYENYGKTLVVKHVDFEDAGEYQCTAKNGVGRPQEHTVQVEVQAKPRFKVEPEVQNKAEGEVAVFECVADGYPTPEIQWFYNGKPLDSTEFYPNRNVAGNRITISNLQKSDTANYGCNATNSIGYVYKDVYVNVLALPPEIQNAPAKQSRTVEGQAVTINCQTFGAPKPIIKWYKDGRELLGHTDRYELLPNGNLIIKKTEFRDAGVYMCNASNKLGHQSASGSLVVKEKTRITNGPQNYEAEAGSTATFRCIAQHDPSLPMKIRWFKDGQYISVNTNNRFVQSSDHSLAILRTTELDSGIYTCMAETDLDHVDAQAQLIVQDVPNPPVLKWVDCNAKDATVVWQPTGENKAPILAFIIQFSTSFNPDTWETATDIVPPGDTSFKVSMTPWANYTFRVIARNKVGNSAPSEASSTCSTPADVPFKNPDNVEGRGTTPHNLVISWTPMKQLEHNAPGFHYKIYWRMEGPGTKWNIREIYDWKQSNLQIEDQPTYKPYKIRIVAHNDLGEANVTPEEMTGYSGEDVPLDAPKNLMLNEVVGPRSAIVSWEAVNPDSVRGDFKGYKIQTWTEASGTDKFREIIMKADSTRSLVQSFKPNTINYARVLAFNGAYNGPSSNTVKFQTPEGKPGPVDSLDCFAMGSSALLLAWTPPQEINGVLTGYRIYYQQVTEGSELGPIQEREPRIMRDTAGKAKLAGLKPHSKYRVTIKATTRAGEGMPYWEECDTNFEATEAPSVPKFKSFAMNPDSDKKARLKITWVPNIEFNPGSHFYVQYKKSDGEQQHYLSTNEELNEDSIVVSNLEPDMTYDFRVVAVDGVFETPSETRQVYTYSTLPPPWAAGELPVSHSGWFIGMILAVLFLVLVCVVVFIIKQNRGGKYSVQEREEQHGRRDPYDDGGFPEFTQPLHDRHLWSAQTSSDLKLPTESDSDSINDYGEGKVAGRFDEDGSFIGQYGTLQRRQQEQLLQQQMQQQELGIKQGGTYV